MDDQRIYKWKPVTSFEEGLQRIGIASEFLELREIIKQTLSLVPIASLEVAKSNVAVVLQKKYELEMAATKDKPMMQNMVDKKFADLAKLLRSFPGNSPIIAQQLPQAPILTTKPGQMPPTPVNKPQLPVRVNNGFGGLAATLFQNWVSAKKRPLIQLGVTGGTLALCILMYNKFFGKPPSNREVSDEERKKNPDKTRERELSDWEKTFKALDRIKQFSEMSRSGSKLSGADYTDFINNNKVKEVEDPQKQEAKKRHSRLDAAGSQLLKDMDSIAKTLRDSPKTSNEPLKHLVKKDDSLPPPSEILTPTPFEPTPKPSPKDSPILTIKPKKRKKRAKLAIIKPIVNENSEKVNEKPRTSSKMKVEISPKKLFEGARTLTPVVKFTKRIRKI